jgi:thiol-disulfide isomerase/thioredoxin
MRSISMVNAVVFLVVAAFSVLLLPDDMGDGALAAVGLTTRVAHAVPLAADTGPVIPWCDIATDDSCAPVECPKDKRTIIYFTATWCKGCKKMEETVFADPRVRARLAKYNALKIDTDKMPEFVKEARVRGTPTVDIFKIGCKVAQRVEGVPTVEQFLKILDDAEAPAAAPPAAPDKPQGKPGDKPGKPTPKRHPGSPVPV